MIWILVVEVEGVWRVIQEHDSETSCQLVANIFRLMKGHCVPIWLGDQI